MGEGEWEKVVVGKWGERGAWKEGRKEGRREEKNNWRRALSTRANRSGTLCA